MTDQRTEHDLRAFLVSREPVAASGDADVATRVQADRDVIIVPDMMGTLLDPSASNAITAKMGIDATRPLGEFPPRLSLPSDAIERARALLRGSARHGQHRCADGRAVADEPAAIRRSSPEDRPG